MPRSRNCSAPARRPASRAGREPGRGRFVDLQQRFPLSGIDLVGVGPDSGTVIPNFFASSRTASVNLSFSCSSMNLITSPPTPQPKQWKKPRSRLTLNEGVFSPWNGHRPF